MQTLETPKANGFGKIASRIAATVLLTGALAAMAATPSEARNGRWAAAGAGFAAGTLLGAAAANANANYYNGYYGPGYYGRGYYGARAYPAPGYYDDGYDSYAYAPGYRAAPYYGYRTQDDKYGNYGYDNMGIGTQ
ncbi:MAG TPA: hypothetical protein VNQ56_01055 [Pseudolabrys sp.]|nr:hypothetical protein [Pseudolabrys sp.]